MELASLSGRVLVTPTREVIRQSRNSSGLKKKEKRKKKGMMRLAEGSLAGRAEEQDRKFQPHP
jgi:hypothetical protein